jgi:hypothetical protein
VPPRGTEPVCQRETNASACPEPTDPAHCDLRIFAIFFFVFAQLFGASVSHFLVSLSHLTTVNSAIFGTVNSVILVTVNSVILATELFLSAILL